jgi:tetratricopeptide (TPR) repeat protein
VVLVAESSIDWTFSFPSLVLATFLVAGAAAGVETRRAAGTAATVAWSAVTLAALAAFAGPFFSAHDVSAAAAPGTPPARAWTLLRHARAFDPWSAEVYDAQGEHAEAAKQYALAARLYLRSAELSRNEWAEQYRRARALRAGGSIAAARAACRRAQYLNPVEPLVGQGACDFDAG